MGQPRQLSLFDATMLVMGGIIGVGIFSNPADIARAVQRSLIGSRTERQVDLPLCSVDVPVKPTA